MRENDDATTIEGELVTLSGALPLPKERECLLCYVYRMLEFGCKGLRWAKRWRDLRALERAQWSGGWDRVASTAIARSP